MMNKEYFVIREPRRDGLDAKVLICSAVFEPGLINDPVIINTINADACFVGDKSIHQMTDKEIVRAFVNNA